MRHYGDITQMSGFAIPTVDIITGGSPCQDLSVAGKREGMSKSCPVCGYKIIGNADENICPICGAELEYTRSGLFMEQIRLVKEMRENDRRNGRTGELVRPRYMVWENVAGAFSSNKGKDFQAVITEIVRVVEPKAPNVPLPDKGGWPNAGSCYGVGADGCTFSVAWRMHDAQYHGVPQRRKRLCVLADFGGLTAPWILFDPQFERASESGEPVEVVRDFGAEPRPEVQSERESLSGNTEPSGTEREENAGAVRGGTEGASGAISFQERAGKPGGGKGILIQNERTGALSTLNNQGVLQTTEPLLLESNQNHATVQTNGISTTLPASMGMGGGYVPMIVGCDVYNQEITGEVAASLTAACGGTNTSGEKVLCLQGNGIDRADTAGCNGKGWREDVSYTLNTIDRPAVIAFSQNQRDEVRDLHDVAGSLAAEPGMKQQTFVADLEPTVLTIDQGAGKSSVSLSENVSPTLATTHDGAPVVLENHPADSRVKISKNGVVQPLSSKMGTGGGNVPLVMYPQTVGALMASGYSKLGTQEAANDMYVVQSRATDYTAIVSTYQDVTGTLSPGAHAGSYNGQDAYNDMLIVAQVAKGPGAVCTAVDCRNGTENENINGTLQAKEQGFNYNCQNVCRCGSVVRRLTPLECERLQGFPDIWSKYGINEKGVIYELSDSARYKLQGNSIARCTTVLDLAAAENSGSV